MKTRKKKGIIRGASAKQKGSRAERQVRDALRTIYPPEKRTNVQRVPLSGGGSIKGDVYDANDWDSCYEVKNQETLRLSDWWAQAKVQAGTSRTPVLVITQAYRPFYYILYEVDWHMMVDESGYGGVYKTLVYQRATNLFDRLAEHDPFECGEMLIGDDDVAIVPEQFYLDVKKALWLDQHPEV